MKFGTFPQLEKQTSSFLELIFFTKIPNFPKDLGFPTVLFGFYDKIAIMWLLILKTQAARERFSVSLYDGKGKRKTVTAAHFSLLGRVLTKNNTVTSWTSEHLVTTFLILKLNMKDVIGKTLSFLSQDIAKSHASASVVTVTSLCLVTLAFL